MWISSTARYAIRAVVHIAVHGRVAPVRVDTIARDLDVPRNYLSKTLHALARDGVLHSGRGPKGGFQLAIPAESLSLARVTAAFDDMEERQCLLGRSRCGGRSPCAAHATWEAASEALRAFFHETTIANLARAGGADVPGPGGGSPSRVVRRSPGRPRTRST